MIIALIALILQVLSLGSNKADALVIIYPADSVAFLEREYESGCMCHDCYWTECFEESLNEFDALFNSYETKRAKNGAMMIRKGNTGPYKFARKG